MPSTSNIHVLTMDPTVIHRVDTKNPNHLIDMWSVFSKCAPSIEQGQRLENISWRVWQKEQRAREARARLAAMANGLPIPINTSNPDLPQLSGSVDSASDEDAVEFTSVSAPLDITHPMILRQNSTTLSQSSRKSDRQNLGSDEFEKMIVSIIKKKDPLPAPKISAATATSSQDVITKPVEASAPIPSRTTTVIRGFSPSSSRSISNSMPREPKPLDLSVIPEPTSAPLAKVVQPKKPAKFALGASCSSSEHDNSGLGTSVVTQPIQTQKKKVFQVGGSSDEDWSLKSALHSSRPNSVLNPSKKTASFSEQVTTRTIESAIEDDSDTEGDFVDESAIEDYDDSSDWEDSIEDSGKSSIDEKLFQRVPSKVNLTSRRSLITLAIEKNERMLARAGSSGLQHSQSTSVMHQQQSRFRNGPSIGMSSSPNDNETMRTPNRMSLLRPINEVSRTGAQPILVGPNQGPHFNAALSPRTTRRNMLATELTESLRRHLLWERQQKSSTANAVLKRRHTSHDVANLKQYPDKVYMDRSEDINATSWNNVLSKEALGGYHSKGW